MYREVCELKIPWGEVMPQATEQKRDRWKVNILTKVKIPRSLAFIQEQITAVDFHVF